MRVGRPLPLEWALTRRAGLLPRWLLNFCAKLLAGDPLAYSLLADDAPFGPGAASPMTYLRADLYRVRFSKPGSAAAARGAHPSPQGSWSSLLSPPLRAGEWYVRKLQRPYIPVPLSLDNPSFQDALRGQGWPVPARPAPWLTHRAPRAA